MPNRKDYLVAYAMLFNMVIMSGIGLLLSGCNGSTSTTSNSNNSLTLIAPKTVKSLRGQTISYIVALNASNDWVNGAEYRLSAQYGGGSSVMLDESSTKKCSQIAPHGLCLLEIIVPGEADTGSFNLAATIGAGESYTSHEVTMGVEQGVYDGLAGTESIALSFYTKVVAGTPYVIVSGLVTSNLAGNFNRPILVDDNDVELPGQQVLRVNPESELAPLKVGDKFEILLAMPEDEKTGQIFKLKVEEIDKKWNVINSAIIGSNNAVTTIIDEAIVDALADSIYLTDAATEQMVSFKNTGAMSAKLQQLLMDNPNIEVNFTPQNLAAGQNLTLTFKLKESMLTGSSSTATLSWITTTPSGNQSDVHKVKLKITVGKDAVPIPIPDPESGYSFSMSGDCGVISPPTGNSSYWAPLKETSGGSHYVSSINSVNSILNNTSANSISYCLKSLVFKAPTADDLEVVYGLAQSLGFASIGEFICSVSKNQDGHTDELCDKPDISTSFWTWAQDSTGDLQAINLAKAGNPHVDSSHNCTSSSDCILFAIGIP